MECLWNTFEEDREYLADRYVQAWANEESFARVDALTAEVAALADTCVGEPHPIVKAKCFGYILDHAPICIEPRDWFGIVLEAQKMTPILDVGCPPRRILLKLSECWTKELSPQLHPEYDEHFCRFAKDHLLNEFYMDYNHSTPNWDDIFRLGIRGLLHRVRQYRDELHNRSPLTTQQSAFFEGVILTYEAILRLFRRYADALAAYNEPKMRRMREAFVHLADNPPSNMYEALLLAWEYWFLQENVDCVRVRTMGGLDQLYREFFENDLRKGTFTEENIRELLTYFMNEFHAIRVHYQQPMYLGGMDAAGNCIVNRLSYVALEAYNILSAPNPKLQVKIGQNTPDAFLRAVLDTIRRGNSSISVMNDDNAALSLEKLGVPREEALTNLMSGCWDYTVKYHEVKTLPVRVSLPKLLEYTITGGRCLSTGETVGLASDAEYADFDTFCAAFERQFLYIWYRVKGIIERWENYLEAVSPSNMFSGTMTDALFRGVDAYARGMKYNTTVYTVTGIATLVDSLRMIKKYVFDQKAVTLAQLADILKNNWTEHEELRAQVLRDTDKYGNGSVLADGLMVRLTEFFARSINGVPNGRGAYWKLGMLSIDKNVRFGALMCATPDGRKSGEPLSKNLSPVIGMDRGGITVLMNSVNKIDFTSFPHAGMLDLILHPSAVSGEDGMDAFCGIVKAYFARGGHSLQFNIVDAETLRAAQREPEKYRNLQIRVCGWNVYFVELEKVSQDAFIRQCEHSEAMCG